MVINLSVLVIDDNKDHADELLNMLQNIPYVSRVVHCHNHQSALSILSLEPIDVVFLDLEMPSMNGLDLLKSFDFPPTIIISSYPAFAIDTYEHSEVLDFIEKPATSVRLMRGLGKVFKYINAMATIQEIFLKVGRKIQNFKLDTILYIEADGIYSKVWLTNGTFVLVNDKISEIEQKLLHTKVIRLHKSYIFNLSYLKAFDSKNIWIDKMEFPLGIKYRNKLNQILNTNYAKTE
jgi:DNA-binding LytR/AlgR family response regulator